MYKADGYPAGGKWHLGHSSHKQKKSNKGDLIHFLESIPVLPLLKLTQNEKATQAFTHYFVFVLRASYADLPVWFGHNPL